MTISFLTVHFTKTSLTFNGRLPWWAPLVGKKAPGTSVVQNVAILHTVHVPDWFERVVLRKPRVRVQELPPAHQRNLSKCLAWSDCHLIGFSFEFFALSGCR